MMSHIGYLKLLLTRSILPGPLDFEIEPPVSPQEGIVMLGKGRHSYGKRSQSSDEENVKNFAKLL